MAYATFADIEARTARTFSEKDQSVCEALLEDAAALIDATGTKAAAETKKVVSCRMVIRAIGDGVTDVPVGATQGSMSALGYSQSWTISNGSTGELYLSKTEKAMLGLGNAIGSYSPVQELAAESGVSS